jgi:hypothetical protein
LSGSDIYYNTGNVGIGIASPTTKLHVNGTVYGESTSYYGVRGQSSDTGVYGTGDNIGVYGVSAARGVWGESEGGHGVEGESDSGVGVYGTSIGRYGVYGHSTSSYGVYGESDSSYGVYGESTDSYGMYGESTDSYGVYGKSDSTTGIFGEGNGSGKAGVYGVNHDGYGVHGVSSSDVGVCGEGGVYDIWAVNARYGSGSSIRWKRNIQSIDDPLDKVLALRGVYFDWDEEHGGKHSIGMIAEEVGQVLPEIVSYEENGVDARGMDYSKLTPLLVEAVKELKAENDSLKQRLEALESKISQVQPDLLTEVQDEIR